MTLLIDWIATKHKSNGFGEWSISPKEYFLTFSSIPDCHANLETPGLEEVMDHTLRTTLNGDDGKDLLVSLGFEILENPIWYFDR